MCVYLNVVKHYETYYVHLKVHFKFEKYTLESAEYNKPTHHDRPDWRGWAIDAVLILDIWDLHRKMQNTRTVW